MSGDACSVVSRISACILFASLLAIIIWVGLCFHIKRPHFDIQEFYIPGLNLSQTNQNTTIINSSLLFDLSLKNVMRDHNIRYGDINLTFSFGHNSVANYTVPPFHQGNGKTAHRRGVLQVSGVPLDAARTVVRSGSRVFFRVDLTARMRFRFWFWRSRTKRMQVGSDIEVDESGLKVGKGIRLKSHAPNQGIGIFVLILNLFITFLSCVLH